jgi:hypothetical protein
VFILGELVRAPDPRLGGYRDGAEGWVLRPPRSGRMLCSTEPLEDRHRRRAKLWRNLALWTLAVLAVWHGLLFAHVHRRRWFGEQVIATAVKTNSWSVWVHGSRGRSGHYVAHFSVDATTDDGRALHSEIDRHSSYKIEEGTRLAFIVVGRDTEHAQIGARACADLGATLTGGFIALLWCLIYWIAVRVTEPWWDRKRILDRGGGALESSRP